MRFCISNAKLLRMVVVVCRAVVFDGGSIPNTGLGEKRKITPSLLPTIGVCPRHSTNVRTTMLLLAPAHAPTRKLILQDKRERPTSRRRCSTIWQREALRQPFRTSAAPNAARDGHGNGHEHGHGHGARKLPGGDEWTAGTSAAPP